MAAAAASERAAAFQPRFTVQPNAADGAWTQCPNVKFEKRGERAFSAAAAPSAAWPVSPGQVAGGGKATVKVSYTVWEK